jgi:hypothetical protein
MLNLSNEVFVIKCRSFDSNKVFLLQNIFLIESCTDLSKVHTHILSVVRKYLRALITFAINNLEDFQKNWEVHAVNVTQM